MSSVVVGFLFADPALHADLAVHGQRFCETVVDVLTQRVQRHATFALPFTTGDVCAAESAGALNTNALGTERHGHFHGLLHGAAESNTTLELQRDVLSDERRFAFGLL